MIGVKDGAPNKYNIEHTVIVSAGKGGRCQPSCSEGWSGVNAVTEDRTAVME